MCQLTFLKPAVQRGLESHCLGPARRPRSVVMRQRWLHCWRRLLLRLSAWNFLRGWQDFMQAIRTPQLREARQLQARRERLEQEALQIAQKEQSIMAQAAASSSSMPQGPLHHHLDEDRVRPRACVKGKGRYLVPELEPAVDCQHLETKHGANRHLTWHQCQKCLQKQEMPLTAITELHVWNNSLIFVPDPFYESKKKKAQKNVKSEKVEESPSTPPTALGSMPKSRSRTASMARSSTTTSAIWLKG